MVECRRVLKWTYAYGYYLPEREHAKRQFFEYLQGEAEARLERLRQCAEKELHTYLTEDASQDAFNNFRTKLAGLTRLLSQSFRIKMQCTGTNRDVNVRCDKACVWVILKVV